MFVPRINEIKRFNLNEKVLGISHAATAAAAAELMSKHHIGCLAVFDDEEKFAGIISERDMLSKVVALSLSPTDVIVKDIMTTSVVACSPESSINEAERLMAKNKIRHLPILQGDKPVSMISSRDVIAYRLKSNKDMQIAAEQLAMLPTGLKSLEIGDVVSLAINEVPKSFGSNHAVLCLASADSEKPVIHCNSCQQSHQSLINAAVNSEIPQSPRITTGIECSGCQEAGNSLMKLVIPLKVHNQCGSSDNQMLSGFLCMCHETEPDKKPEQSHFYKASLLQQVLNTNLTNARLYSNYQNARKDSETDPLTGVGTRRVIEKVLKTECARASRYHQRFSLAIIDMDKFKQINDTAGHAAGDNALKQLAKLIRNNIRETDFIIARYGGDEFVLVMPETPITGGKVVLERIRRQLKTLHIPDVDTPTISCGLTEWNSIPPDSPESIMGRADEALYEAKRTGRNKVVAFEPAEPIEA